MTKPQLALLQEICESSRHVASYYKPAIALKAMGFAVDREFRWTSSRLYPTEAGRAYIESLKVKP